MIKKLKLFKIFVVLGLLVFSNNGVLAKVAVNDNYKSAYLNLDWWKKFGDPTLNDYLTQAYKNNNDLKIASIKISEGQQLVKQSFGQELPQFQILGNLDRTFRSSNLYYGDVLIPEYSQNQFTLPLTMNYEIDIWGKNRLMTKSAETQLEIIKQSERATYISLTSALAADYYNLVKINKMLDYQNKIVDIQKNIMFMIDAKHKKGLASRQDVIFEQKNLTIANDEKNKLEQDKAILTNQLRVLLALPQDAKITSISFDKIKMMNIPQQVESGIIQNRPDFKMAQDQLKKIGIDVKVAKKELLPSFIINGQVGFNSYKWGNIFAGKSFISSVGVIPFWDVFTGGKKKAYLKLKKFEYDEATQKYEKTLLTSFQEVNDSLVIAKTAQKNYKESLERLALETESYNLTSQKYEIGGAAKIQKLRATEAYLISQKNEVSNKINCMISVIGLYKAVGGKDLYFLNEEKI